MPLTSLLYVSKSSLSARCEEAEIDKIVTAAQRNNILLNLTGALLYTGDYFAQVLEGSDAEMDLLLNVVMEDARHRDIIIVDRSTTEARRFPDWRMAYSGPSQFVSGFVDRLIDSSSGVGHDQASAWLQDPMFEFNRA